MDKKLVEKVKKLLRLSSSPNENEARLALQKAQALMLEHNIDAGDLKETAIQSEPIAQDFGRRPTFYLPIATVLEACFGVIISWHNRDGEIKMHGREVNIEIGKYVYDYLAHLLPFLAKQKGIRDRKVYYYGVAQGIISQLNDAKDNSKADSIFDVVSERGLTVTKETLVIRDYLISKLGFAKTSHRYSTGGSYEQGIRDGKKVRINPGVNSGSGETKKLGVENGKPS